MKLKTEPYKHQEKAVEKLSKIKVGALYMEMGTGKTRTALELIKNRLDRGKINHVLWLCPCNAKITLKEDIKKHASGDLSMFTICGIETLSSSIRANAALLRLVQKKNVYLIVDESNLVKNHRAKRTQNITRLAEYCKYKLILNGTPITKNEKDLFAQWYILDWRILGYQSFWSFAANHLEYDDYGRLRNTLNVDYLVKKISPYTYQVKKDECLDLPCKTYSTKYYEMTEEQMLHYRDVANQLLFELDEYEPHTIYRLFTGLQNVIGGMRVTVGDTLKNEPFFDEPMEDPRMVTIMDLVAGSDEKTIIFCKYTHEIKNITRIINEEYGEDTAVAFYGELNQKTRQENLKKFKGDSQFLVANKNCAGYALNLQFCSYVIYYSNDWDYGTRGQSEDRVHRIGQKNNVHYIDICAAGTLDEKILDCLWRKENLVDSFKSELEKQKDKKYEELWIYGKTYRGNNYAKKVKVNEYKDLQEVN